MDQYAICCILSDLVVVDLLLCIILYVGLGDNFMTDTEKAVLERRIDELCADMEQMRKTATMLASARTDLLAENAKLRELCADLRFCKRNNCLTYSHGRFCDMRFDERYTDLGVEID